MSLREPGLIRISQGSKFVRAVAGLCLWLPACAPDAVKSADTGKKTDPATSQMSTADLDKLPALTVESIRQRFADCALPSGFGESSQEVYAASLATPGPIKYVHKASGCFIGFGESIGTVSVTPSVTFRGPFTAPVLNFAAATTIESACRDKYSGLAAGDAAPFQRTISYQVLPVDKRPDRIGTVGPWKMAVCTLAPVVSLDHQFKTPGAGSSAPSSLRIQVEFIPALPAIVVPAAARGRAFTTELGKGLQFEKIVARVKTSNDPRLPPGREVTGTVTILPVSPQKAIIDPDANTQTNLSTDIGIKVMADFGSPQVTLALGLFPAIEYFIDKTTSAISFISTANPDSDPRRPEILYK